MDTPKKKKVVSMSDIAKEMNVSLMTISMALRDHSRISEKTKERVRKTADRLGYERDPELSRLMAYIRDRKTLKHQANLAFIHYYGNKLAKVGGSYVSTLLSSAQERAESLGYSLEPIDVSIKGMTQKRLKQIFETRNIQGLMLCPHITGFELSYCIKDRLPVESYPGVSFAHSLTNPKYSRIAINHYQCMLLAMDKLNALGFQRIGLAMDIKASEKVRDLWIAGHMAWQVRHLQKLRIDPLLVQQDWNKELMSWIAEQKPDVIICQSLNARKTLEQVGYKIPRDISLAYTNVNLAGDPEGSGIFQNLIAQGQLASDYLISQILARQKGVPENNVTILVKGTWQEGKTVAPPHSITDSPRRLTRPFQNNPRKN